MLIIAAQYLFNSDDRFNITILLRCSVYVIYSTLCLKKTPALKQYSSKL